MTLNGDTFSNNEAANESAPGTGGAIANLGTLTVTGCNSINNTAQGDGGAIENMSSLTVNASAFTSNTASANGGAIENLLNLTIQGGNTFTSNAAADNGGAIENFGFLNLNGQPLAANNFYFNTANENGGAIDSNAASKGVQGPPYILVVSNTNFYGNQVSTGAGGAVNTADNSSFSSDLFASGYKPGDPNTPIPNQAYTQGGAINATGGNGAPSTQNLSVNGCTFNNNQVMANGAFGGAICTAAVGNSISSSVFDANLATQPNGSGGAVADRFKNLNSPAVASNASFTISQSLFEKNIADARGGAIFLIPYINAGQLQVSMQTTTFWQNQVNNGSGGAVYLYDVCTGTASATATFTNDTFFQNNATGGVGGAIDLASLDATQSTGTDTASLTSLTIYDNTATQEGGGVAIGTTTTQAVSFVNNILDGNHSPGSVDISEDVEGSAKDIGWNLIDPSDTGILSDAKDIAKANPGLTTPLADNNAKPGYQPTLALADGSPALGAGDVELYQSLDERGYTRGINGPISIGAEDPNAG